MMEPARGRSFTSFEKRVKFATRIRAAWRTTAKVKVGQLGWRLIGIWNKSEAWSLNRSSIYTTISVKHYFVFLNNNKKNATSKCFRLLHKVLIDKKFILVIFSFQQIFFRNHRSSIHIFCIYTYKKPYICRTVVNLEVNGLNPCCGMCCTEGDIWIKCIAWCDIGI